MRSQKTTRYDLVVKNRPGELAKLTKFLSDEGVNLCSLRVANAGDKASISLEIRAEDARDWTGAPLSSVRTFSRSQAW